MMYEQSEQHYRNDLAQAVKKTGKVKRTKTVIEAAQEIVAGHQASRFRGVFFDAFSASAIINVYNALNPENRSKFEAMDKGDKVSLVRMIDVSFKLHKRGK